MNNIIDTSGLKDILIPPRPDIFPLAWGWNLLIALLLIMGITLFILLYRYHTGPKYHALKILKDISTKKSDNLSALAAEISKLLKRVLLVKYPRKYITTLSGEKWQHFLIDTVPDNFTEKEAELIAFSTFKPQKETDVSVKKLLVHTEKFIRLILRKKNGYKK